MFKERLISSVILMAVTIFTVVFGGNVLFGAILIISIIGLTELYKILKIESTLLGMAGYVASILFDFMILFQYESYVMVLIIGYLMVLMFIYVFSFPKYNSEQVTLAFFGLFYVSVMLDYIYRVRMLEDGLLLVWLIFIGAWGSDTCAYCVGMLIGKHKMSPKLSPKKSIEGGIGGVVGAALIGLIYGTIMKDQITLISNPQFAFMVIGGVSSIISQVGDLAASAIKRNHDIKDYGKLIPGHGGILDRFDSIIFTAPIVYFLVEILK